MGCGSGRSRRRPPVAVVVGLGIFHGEAVVVLVAAVAVVLVVCSGESALSAGANDGDDNVWDGFCPSAPVVVAVVVVVVVVAADGFIAATGPTFSVMTHDDETSRGRRSAKARAC